MIHLNDRTLRTTVGARPVKIVRSMRIIGTEMILEVCPRRVRMTAMISWAKRKKSGALVTFRTHLLLETSKCEKNKCQRSSIDKGRTPLPSNSERKVSLSRDWTSNIPRVQRQDRT
jgi:hypothetical protein